MLGTRKSQADSAAANNCHACLLKLIALKLLFVMDKLISNGAKASRLCRVRCYSFDPSVVSIGAVSGRPIATVIVYTVALDDYCVLTS